MAEAKSPNEVLSILERAHKMSISGPGVPETETTYGLAAMTVRSLMERLEMVEPLARALENIGTRYTRAFGAESNAERVLGLHAADEHAIAQRLRAVVATGEDPGDPRYLCMTINCSKGQQHSGEHDV